MTAIGAKQGVIASVDADISTTLQGILLSSAKSLFAHAKLPGSFC
jgi:hypothetical protein